MTAGSATVCTFTLSSGSGSCVLGGTAVKGVTVKLTASYLGGASGPVAFSPSTSGTVSLAVAKAGTSTALTLSAGTAKYGHEQSEKLAVTVSPQYSGTPTGKVTIKAGSMVWCTVTLNGGKGGCTLSASQLRPGTYHLVAYYLGDGNFGTSASPARTLTVSR